MDELRTTSEALRRGVTDALWPRQAARLPGSGTLRDRQVADDVVVDDLRLHSPRNPSDPIPAFLARPREATGRLPAVVCLHGSGRSRELLMEEAYRFEQEPARLHGWARELARRGFAALAITQRSYGGRPGPIIQEWAKTELLYGRTAMGALVEDALCAVDYLAQECPEVDPERIGMAGFSLGGIVTFYSAIVDPRIRAAVPVCGGIGSLEALVDHGTTAYHSAYYYVPGLLQVGDHAALVAAVVPRALLVIGADQDVGMPLDGLQGLGQQGRAIYERAGHPEAFAVSIESGGHNFTPAGLDKMEAWFRRHLSPAT
jgi:dienelactone hydrolase